VTADARLDRLTAIADLRARLTACRAVLTEVRTEYLHARRLRDGLIYTGTDLFADANAPLRCRVVEDPPPGELAAPCPLPHKSMGLCQRHYQMWQRVGRPWNKPWAEGGLGLDSPPSSPYRSRGWRARALRLSGISNTTFADVTRLRHWPTEAEPPGLYAYESAGASTVVRLPDPPIYSGEAEHWAAAGVAHRAAKDATALDEAIQHTVRNPTVWELMRSEPSNTTIADLLGVGEQWVYELRRMDREGHAA
jgi:hypothetical protein